MITQKWLLDNNLGRALGHFLRTQGIVCHHAYDNGWADLKNGELTKAAYEAGYRILLTRDKLFHQSAKKILAQYKDFCVVVLTFRQAKGKLFITAFTAAWNNGPIVPSNGKVIVWP